MAKALDFMSGRNELRGQNFYIKEGVMVFENLFIPLDSISVVELSREPAINITLLIVYVAIIGFMGLLVPSKIFHILGFVVVFIGGCVIYFAIKSAKKKSSRN